jgi:hypothetical protein
MFLAIRNGDLNSCQGLSGLRSAGSVYVDREVPDRNESQEKLCIRNRFHAIRKELLPNTFPKFQEDHGWQLSEFNNFLARALAGCSRISIQEVAFTMKCEK